MLKLGQYLRGMKDVRLVFVLCMCSCARPLLTLVCVQLTLSCLPISNEAVMYVVEHCPRLHFIDLRGAFFSPESHLDDVFG